MSADNKHKRPIIIKRVQQHEDEHGGAWKIAYADFVTAMMAFFLVMWLLSSVTDKQRRGIARYFSATSIMDMRSGDGVMDGSHSALDGADSRMSPITISHENTEVQSDQDINSDNVSAGNQTSGRDQVEGQRFDAMKAEVERIAKSGDLKDLSKDISVEMTPDGLRVQIFDRDGAPMFAPGSAEPNERLTTILDALLPVLGSVRNPIIITGHTDNQPMNRVNYSNWELSADRANGTRRYVEAHGIAAARIFKVEGRADADPLLPQTPADPRNRRIALTLLRSDVAAQMRSAAPRTEQGT